MNPHEEGGVGNQEQDVNAFTKGKGKGGKGGYWPYQGAWNGNPSGTGYQGICWGCGEVGHQQQECPKKIQHVDCDNVECDFFFGAVESEDIGTLWDSCNRTYPPNKERLEPPISDFERTFKRIRRGVRFGGCAGNCEGKCGEHRDDTSKDSDEISVLGETDKEGSGEWKEVQSRKMKRIKKREWKKVDLCNVEGEGEEGGTSTIKVDFQVAAVKKPLMSVKRICENGNRVCFGPKNGVNYVINAETKKKVHLRPNGKGSYLLDAKFKGGEDISVVVDSGAEENVCPYWWGEQFGISEPKAWLNFSGANGAKIPHYGKRAIVMESTF